MLNILKVSGAELIIIDNNSPILDNVKFKKYIKKNKVRVLSYNQITNYKKKITDKISYTKYEIRLKVNHRIYE